jgi:hypothetical protein
MNATQTTHAQLLKAFGVKARGTGDWSNIYLLPDGRKLITGEYCDEMNPVLGTQLVQNGSAVEFIPESNGSRIIQVIENSQLRANIIAAILKLKEHTTEDPTEHEVIMGVIEKLESII